MSQDFLSVQSRFFIYQAVQTVGGNPDIIAYCCKIQTPVQIDPLPVQQFPENGISAQ